MSIESLPRIAVLGAGPVGIEAALYARFLGYPVEIVEGTSAAANVLRYGHVNLFSPFRLLRSTLGLAALAAQDAGYAPLDDDALVTAQEWAERYLIPLAKTDLLVDCLREGSRVLSISRTELAKQDLPNELERGASPFRILVEQEQGQRDLHADIVIDCTGILGNPNWIGRGGAPAIGELENRNRIDYHIPDLLGADRDRFRGRRILVLGSGHAAATSVSALVELKGQEPSTEVAWVTRRSVPDGPVRAIDRDPSAERDRIIGRANGSASTGAVTHWPDTSVDGIWFDEAADSFRVVFGGVHEQQATFDRIIANVGHRPDTRIYDELQVHECYATGGPMRLAAALLKDPPVHSRPTAHGPETLVTTEPNFYILGSKSFGRAGGFSPSVGVDQVRKLFTVIGGRKDLDLYRGANTLLG